MTPEKKISYADLVHQVVQESQEPLAFAEILRRVEERVPITTKNPKATIRSAITQSRLIVTTGDGRYGWKPRLINGARIRLPLTQAELDGGEVVYSNELRDILWPTFFAGQMRSDRAPVHVALPDGREVAWTLGGVKHGWGTTATPEFWDWLRANHPQSGDELIVEVVDGEARRYAVTFSPRTGRDEAAIAERNRQLVQATRTRANHSTGEVFFPDLCDYLFGTGFYRHPLPPDPLEPVLRAELKKIIPALRGDHEIWSFPKIPEVDPLVSSLVEQVRADTHRRRSKIGSGSGSSGPIYQLSVTLIGSRPTIWRRVQVRADMLLPELHAVLQIAMGWTNSHLHGFRVGQGFYSEPSPEYGMEVIDEGPVRLDQIAPAVGAAFVYEYDFGDSWEHQILVEKILPAEPEGLYPRVLDGKRACPPEDVGGVPSYAEFLKAIGNPRSRMHEEYLIWAGGAFDPDAVDIEGTNALLRSFQERLGQ